MTGKPGNVSVSDLRISMGVTLPTVVESGTAAADNIMDAATGLQLSEEIHRRKKLCCRVRESFLTENEM